MSSQMINRNIVHCLLLVIIGLACYSNSFTVPFSFDDEINIADNTLIRDLGNFTGQTADYASNPAYNPRRYIGLLTFALDYRLHGLDVAGYHAVNISIHILNAVLVYFLVLLTFRTPYFSPHRGEAEGARQGARGNQRSAVSLRQTRVRSSQRSGSQVVDEATADSTAQPLNDSRSTIQDLPSFIALFAALLFVAHPIQTQAVTYIVQRYTSLATLFYLFSVVMYIKGRLGVGGLWEKDGAGARGGTQAAKGAEHEKIPLPGAGRLSSVACYLLSVLSAVLAMKTKEISFTLPFMIALYEFFFFSAPLRKRLLFLVPVLITLTIIPVTVIGTDRPLGDILSDLSAMSRLQTDMPRPDYLLTEMRVIVTYLRLLVVPVNQSLDYDYPNYHSLFSPPVFMSLLLLLSLLGAAGWLLHKSRQAATENRQSAANYRRTKGSHNPPPQRLDDPRSTIYESPFALYRLIAFGIFWFFIALSVESSVIPITDVIFEHRVYLPSIGAFIALAAGLYAAWVQAERRWPLARKALIPLFLIILALLGGATYMRNDVWKNNVTLWEDAVGKFPRGVRPRVMLGQALLKEGNADRAIWEFQEALEIQPFSFNARIYLGLAFASKGWNDRAVEQYRMAVMIKPDSADARNNLGVALFKNGAVEQAVEQYKGALGINPANASFHFNLGIAYEQAGLIDEAVEEYAAAARLNPSEPAFRLALANASGKMNSLRQPASVNEGGN